MKVYELMQKLGELRADGELVLTIDLPNGSIKVDEDGATYARCTDIQNFDCNDNRVLIYSTAAREVQGYCDDVVYEDWRLEALMLACENLAARGHCVHPPQKVYDADSETYVTEPGCEYDNPQNDCVACWRCHFEQKAKAGFKSGVAV